MAKRILPPFGVPRRSTTAQDALSDLAAFGSNPGNLGARIFVPDRVASHPALVVVLHGCTQTAAGYDSGAGWSSLAEEFGFVLLFPEQRRANNPNLCFNWFSPGDIRRDQGEALSIRQMIATVVAEHGVDPERIFITGLSAGGAMTSVMLATYPEVFAGGAIIAGLPYGSATGVPQALDRMRGQAMPEADALAVLVRGASQHAGRWPTVSVWHGGSDTTVDASNAEAIVAQWRALHGVGVAPDAVDAVDGYPHEIWRDGSGRVVIETYKIMGMGHGTPLKTSGRDACGRAGPHMIEAGISSTRRIAAFWDLASEPQTTEENTPVQSELIADVEPSMVAGLPIPRVLRPERIYEAAQKRSAPAKGVSQIIEDALRAAGLMR
jgi:poly(hydroxyalkanoate) depolymerase family esterase